MLQRSKKFARLIAENKYEEALLVARKQVDGEPVLLTFVWMILC